MVTKRQLIRDLRQLPTVRAEGEGSAAKSMLVGYAAIFDRGYDCFDPFFSFDVYEERIDRRAFDRTLRENQDVRALRNHDWNAVLGRGKNGTLRLSADGTGLAFEVDLNIASGLGRDTLAEVERGDIDGCSFGFIIRGEKVDRTDKSRIVRTILDVDLLEITPACSFPMNPETSVNARDRGDRHGRPRLELARLRLRIDRD